MTHLESYLAGLQRFGINPGLERVRALLDRLGASQLSYPVMLVGGTNGKGSTSEFLAGLLTADGAHVGLYTSPHLYRWNERIRVLRPSLPTDDPMEDAQNPFPGTISDDELDALLQEALPHLEAVAAAHGQPTEFETLTALGFRHFQRAGVDVAVVEVGLGGRWDATNVAEPVVSVITHVALDHTDRLGSTLPAIASDKVEIARSGRILVTAETKPEVLQVFQDYCSPRQVRLWPIRAAEWSNDRDAMTAAVEPVRALPAAAPEALVQSGGPAGALPELLPFQQVNLFTAAVARLAWQRTVKPGPPPETAAGAPPAWGAAGRLRVAGRAEVLRQRPTLIIDGANNPDGALYLRQHLERVLEHQHPVTTATPRLILVLGILADKDYTRMVETLAPLAGAVIATQSASPRAEPAGAVAREARRYCTHVEELTPVPAAVRRALEVATPDDIICVTGSFYTIAEVDRAAVAGASRGATSSVFS